MRGVPVAVCMTCGHRAFPERLLCPVCGGGDRRHEWADRGVLEEVTALRRSPGHLHDPPVRLGTVRLLAGPRVVARVEADLAPGMQVALDVDRDAVVARPVPDG